MRDFNYQETDWEHWISNSPKNHISHQFIEAIRDSFLHEHVELCTRFRENQSPSLIDLVFSSDELFVNNTEYLSPVGKSDHRVILFVLTALLMAIYKEDKHLPMIAVTMLQCVKS